MEDNVHISPRLYNPSPDTIPQSKTILFVTLLLHLSRLELLFIDIRFNISWMVGTRIFNIPDFINDSYDKIEIYFGITKKSSK